MAILFLGVGTWFMVLPSIDRGLAGALSSIIFSAISVTWQDSRGSLCYFSTAFTVDLLKHLSLRPRLGFGIR